MKSCVFGCALVLAAGAANATISYTTVGGGYSQNFDSLPVGGEAAVAGGWVDNSTLAGWYSNQTALFRTSNGSANNGGLYSFGSPTATSTERALGSTAGGTGAAGTGTPFNGVAYGAVFVNNTGVTLTDVTIQYDGEQWRNGGNATQHKLSFSYQIISGALPAGFLTGSGYTSHTALDFTGPIASTTAGALDGNLAANRVAGINSTITGLTWNAGDMLIIRWSDPNDTGNDHGLAIDNLSFSAVPTPGTLVLMGLASLSATRRRR